MAGFGCDPLHRKPRAPGRRPKDAVVEEARGAIRILAELNQQDGLPDQVKLLRQDIRRVRQMRQQRIGGRVGSKHGQKKAAAPREAAASLSTFRRGSEPDAAAQEDPPAQRIVGLRVRVAVAGRTREAGDRRILVQDVVDAQ